MCIHDAPSSALIHILACALTHRYHYDIVPVASSTTGQLSSITIDHCDEQSRCKDWKLYLVQELCHSSMVKAMAAGLFHAPDKSGEERPEMVSSERTNVQACRCQAAAAAIQLHSAPKQTGSLNAAGVPPAVASQDLLLHLLTGVASGMVYLHNKGIM